MVKVIGPRDPKDPEAINTTSRSPNWSKGLSPFFLGPVELYDGYIAQNVENGWQFSKVYSQHLGSDGEPSELYFKWATAGWDSTYAQRYPMGKGVVPAFSYWAGEKYTYIEARKNIYVPLYAGAVRESDAFQRLQAIYKEQGTITLWDFDGYNHRQFKKSYSDVVSDPSKKCGHGFVLAMMLEGEL